jgi:hypothetical protein
MKQQNKSKNEATNPLGQPYEHHFMVRVMKMKMKMKVRAAVSGCATVRQCAAVL